ncbi:MAG: adenylate/guanylate cyclase domain-containing protein, partial [Pseudomonadota bacterium]
PVGQVLLGGALLIHLGCALAAIYKRDSLRMRPWEAAQLILGLLIPLQLFAHIIATRGVFYSHGVASDYSLTMVILWQLAPVSGFFQAVLLVAAWVHGCIGLYFWQMPKPWFARWAPILLALAAILPTISLAGYVSAGLEARALVAGDGALSALLTEKRATPDSIDFLQTLIPRMNILYLALVAGALVARTVRLKLRPRRARIRYPGDVVVDVPPGATLLGTSIAHDIPHAAVCGGRGRCSTCRVLIVDGGEGLPAADSSEEKVLKRVGAANNVRLACQVRPTRDLEIVPLLPASATAADGFAKADYAAGKEQEIAILFADLRGFTSLTEAKLPYDVVFLLNRYFALMGSTIETSGGRLDKFIGDGIMALFGVESGPEEGCRRALRAATGMIDALGDLNRSMASDLKDPLKMGIGIHIGPAIVGDMGYGTVKGLTAVGDAVNTASRLEAMTKTLRSDLVISAEVARRAGIDDGGFEPVAAEIRGKSETLPILVLRDPSVFTERLPQIDQNRG